MSFQSVVAGMFLRWRVKNGIKPMKLDYLDARQRVNRISAMGPGAPSDITHTPIAADPAKGLCAAEWLSAPNPQRTVVYFHGGGYFFCSLETHRAACGYLARKSQARVLSVDYRMAPEHACPAAVEDALAWWQELLNQGVNPQEVVFAGDSAGGGLVLACLVAARDRGLPMPAGALLFSPWADLSCSGETMKSQAKADVMFNPYLLPQAAELYLQGRPNTDPLASPLFANLTGLPEMLIFASEHEILLSDSTRLYDKARQAGIPVQLIKRPRMPHVWPILILLPEAREDMSKSGQFIARVTSQPSQAKAA
jgi:epsilon-lactone hydrolase